jgi:hypothetical protein
MASEKQRAGGLLEDFGVFQERLRTLDLDHLGLVLPMLYWNISFWEAAPRHFCKSVVFKPERG